MYRLLLMRIMRRPSGIIFAAMVPTDIPKIDTITNAVRKTNSI